MTEAVSRAGSLSGLKAQTGKRVTFVSQKDWIAGFKGGCSVPKEGHPPSAQPPFGGGPSGFPGAGRVQ